jgi:hypothetical protein
MKKENKMHECEGLQAVTDRPSGMDTPDAS